MQRNRSFIIILLLAGLGLVLPAVRAQLTSGDKKVFTLRHAEPTEVRRILIELLGTQAKDVSIQVDTARRQITFTGPKDARELAIDLIQQVDKPLDSTDSPTTNSRPADSTSETRPATKQGKVAANSSRTATESFPHVYRVTSGSLDEQAWMFRQVVGDKASVSLRRETREIVVNTSAEMHARLQRMFRESTQSSSKKTSAPNRTAAPVRREIRTSLAGEPDTLFPVQQPALRRTQPTLRKQTRGHYVFRNITSAQCQRALGKLLQRGISQPAPDQMSYTAVSGNKLTARFDMSKHECHFSGDAELVEQFQLLFTGFDNSRDADGNKVRFIPLKNVRPEVLREALQKWRSTTGRNQSQQRTLPNSQSQVFPQSPIRQAAFVQANQPASTNVQDDTQQPDDLRRPSPDVDVKPLPDLDVLILQGRDPDVDELTRIIREIERISEETTPEIQVYQLRNVHGPALNTLIATVQEDLIGPLQGRVTITPLVKPNALLLIGWGEAVKAAIKLIAELDQGVDPASQMQVFRLKHAPAAEITTTIEQFLNGRGGLAPDVNVTANARSNSIVVNASPRDMVEVARLIERLDVASSEAVNQAKVIQLKNALAADVAATISAAITAARGGGTGQKSAALEMLLVKPNGESVPSSGLLEDVKLTPDARTNRIFITGPAESLPLVEQLIQQFDESPAATAQIKVFEITNGDASDLVVVLRSLFPEVAGALPQLATAAGEHAMVPVRFSVDIRTNTIICTGTTGDLKIIEALLVRLDQSAAQQRVNRVYRLKNSPATEVARAVNDFLRSERIVNQAAPGRQNPFQQIEQEVIVVPEPVRNSLIISATERYFNQIVELVEELDEQPPQVMIQVILAEVDLDSTHEFGVELGLQDSLLFDRGLLGDLVTTAVTTSTSTANGVVTTTSDNIIAASNSPGFDFNNQSLGNSGSTRSLATAGTVAGQALSNFALGRVNSDLQYGGLVLSASSENVSVLLRALDESGSMEVLSRPQIMTLDNQQAFIQVGQRVPRITNSQLTQFGQINSLSLEDVGLLLGVTPRISPDGNVVMEIDAEKSRVGPEREGIPISVSTNGEVIRSPRVDVTTAQTTISASSGQTVVIGGLITTEALTVSRRVPWLSDVPLLGNLFRYDGSTNQRKELLIILTPHVIMGRSEAEYMKQVELARMSWVSSDVFDWVGSGSIDHSQLDDADVPTVFPDKTPHLPDLQLDPADSPSWNQGSTEKVNDNAVVPAAWESTSRQSKNSSPQQNNTRQSLIRGSADNTRGSGRKPLFGWKWGAKQ